MGNYYTFFDLHMKLKELYGDLSTGDLVCILEYTRLEIGIFNDEFWKKLIEYPLPSEACLNIIQCDKNEIISKFKPEFLR